MPIELLPVSEARRQANCKASAHDVGKVFLLVLWLLTTVVAHTGAMESAEGSPTEAFPTPYAWWRYNLLTTREVSLVVPVALVIHICWS